MRRIKVDQYLEQAHELHKNGDVENAEKIYHEVLNNHPDMVGILYALAEICIRRGQIGLAVVLLQQVVQHLPDFVEAWNNLGCALKQMGNDKSAEFCFKRAMKLDPNRVDFPANISGVYVNANEPEKCIEWADKALALPHTGTEPAIIQAKWHKALALLELKRWQEGWEFHESRLSPHAGLKLEPRNYATDGSTTPWWDGQSPGLVAIHGEQGLGDEIMFSSCLKEAAKTDADLVFECAPRLEKLMKRSFPEVIVVGTHKTDGSDWKDDNTVDYKLAVGSLPKFYRNRTEDFPGTPFLKPDPKLVEQYAQRLHALGTRPKIGIAWQGGVLKTRVDLRSLTLKQLEPILKQDADFISLQYHQTAQLDVEEFFSQTGIVIHHWPEAAMGTDMDYQAALVANLDLVISVCQTCNHVAGGLGIPCWVLVPTRPSWREGVSGDAMPWYKSVKLYRQPNDDWKPVIERVSQDLSRFIDAHQRGVPSVKQAVA